MNRTSEYQRLSIAEKQARHRQAMREPTVPCPAELRGGRRRPAIDRLAPLLLGRECGGSGSALGPSLAAVSDLPSYPPQQTPDDAPPAG